jgi:hypothetical protein
VDSLFNVNEPSGSMVQAAASFSPVNKEMENSAAVAKNTLMNMVKSP